MKLGPEDETMVEDRPLGEWSDKKRKAIKKALRKSRNLVRCRMKSRKGLGRRRYK